MKIKELQEAAYAGNRQIDTPWYTLYDVVEKRFVHDITRHAAIDYIDERQTFVSFLSFRNEEAARGYVEDMKHFIKKEFDGDTDSKSPMPRMLEKVQRNFKYLDNIEVVKLQAAG